MRRADQLLGARRTTAPPVPPKPDGLAALSARPAFELVERIKKNLLDPRHLSKHDRLNIVELLRWDGWGQWTIAELLRCSDRTIRRDIAFLKRQAHQAVGTYTTDQVASDTIVMAEGLRQKAIKKGDFSTAWRITKELPEVLQSLGKLHKEPERFVGHMTLAELIVSAATPQADDPTRAGGVNRLSTQN